MKYYSRFLILFLFFIVRQSFAQSSEEAKALVKEGVELSNQKKYPEAIAKYQQALKIELESASANYQLGFALFASAKGLDAAPYLEKVTKAGASAALTVSSYDLLGSIYDQAKQPKKAVEYYKAGIAAAPDNAGIHYNLGLAYFRSKQYPEAEEQAIAVLKLDSTHTGSHRLYALVTFHQNKRVPALMGFCRFLMLEPKTARSSEAFGNIQHILQGGALKPDGGFIAKDATTLQLNKIITQVVTDSSKRKYSSAAALFEAQLRAIFDAVGQQSAKQQDKDFFWSQYADEFYQLSKSAQLHDFCLAVSSLGK